MNPFEWIQLLINKKFNPIYSSLEEKYVPPKRTSKIYPTDYCHSVVNNDPPPKSDNYM